MLISVIVPTLNEEANLPVTLRQLAEHPDVELIVVDGGSSARTVPRPRAAEHIVAEYQQDTQTGKLTGGVTCYNENNKPVSEFAFYLAATEPRK